MKEVSITSNFTVSGTRVMVDGVELPSDIRHLSFSVSRSDYCPGVTMCYSVSKTQDGDKVVEYHEYDPATASFVKTGEGADTIDPDASIYGKM